MKKELRDGLMLRSLSEGIASDYHSLGKFYVDVFAEEGDENAEILIHWVEDLISDHHPTMSLDDVWVVVDPSQDDCIVSALLLIPQTWRYENVEMLVGRVELVATLEEYRHRGLVRELMNVAHERSSSLGHIMQGITGIGYFYRQFGYAMTINLGSDAQLPIALITTLKPDQTPQYTLRPATTTDIIQIQEWEAYEQQNGGLTVKRDWSNWDYDLNHCHPDSSYCPAIYIVANIDGQDVGFVSFLMDKYHRSVNMLQFTIGEHASYFDTFDDVLRAIKTIADEFYATLPDDKYPQIINFDNGLSPAIKALIHKSNGKLIQDKIYAWYIRVDDLSAFIKHIAPILEKRLEGSGVNRFTGELKIGFFDLNSMKISFEGGKITDVVISAVKQDWSDTAMPYQTFLNILFGHRDWRELSYILPEVYANRKADMLLTALFPKMQSQIGEGIA
jgi:hypothetical protein